MERIVQNPTCTVGTEPWRKDEIIEEHPAFGVIGASRVSCSEGDILFGSEFRHRNFIRIRIASATKTRALSSDWIHSQKEYIEVDVSEAQWATFVCSMNVADGVPCTLRYLQGKGMPLLPDPPKATETFNKEQKDTMKQAVDEINQARTLIAESGLSKVKQKEIFSLLGMAERDITSSVDYVAERFDKHMEKTVEKAKTEIYAFQTGHALRIGQAVLNGEKVDLNLPHLTIDMNAAS